MRNLKRALSLTLASVMLLGMMVVGSSAAAGYDDVAETDNVEAIEVLQAVQVMVGDERGFGPERPVNRAEMAVVMGKLLNLDYNYYEAICPFNDVYDWARGWVGACYANGIVSGRGEGVYDPGTTVTAVEAASMLMRALGYFKYQSDYSAGFETATVLQANKIRLFDGVDSTVNAPLTRNQVAQMALNALKTGMVEPDGNTLNFIDTNGNIIASGGKVNYVNITSNKAFATAISDVRASSMGSANDAPIVELGEQLYNGKLKLTDTTDDFERPARYWEYDAKAIGTYVKEELLREQYTVKVTGRTLHDLLGSTTIKDYDLVVAIDGVDDADVNSYVFNKSAMVRTNENAVGKTGKGVLTQVFVDPDEGANGLITIAIINTYLAIAEEDFDDRTDDVDFRVYGIEPIPNFRDEYWKTANISNSKPTDESSIFKLELEDFPEVAEVKESDAHLVTVAKGEVQTLSAPEILSTVQISSFKQGDWIVTGGTQYDFASAAEFEMDTLYDYTATDNAVVNLKDINYNVYLDKYGYAIGVEEVDRVDNYMFITGVDTNTVNRYAVQADASAIFLDGTMEAVKIDMKAARDLVDQSTYNALVGTDAEIQDNVKGGSLINKWFTYTVGNDGVYEVVLVGDDVAVDKGARAGQFRTLTTKDENIPYGAGFAALGTSSHGVDEIGRKSIALRGADTANSTWYSVYGDDQSVYITAELETIQDANGDSNYHVNIISGVDNVAVGIDEASIDVWSKGTALAKGSVNMKPVATAYGSYVLFDDDGDIIGAVVVGEDSGATTNLVYTHKSKIESETDNNASGSGTKANSSKGDYTWTRKVVSNGEEVLLTEVGSGLSKLKSMLPNTWYVVKYNAKGEVKNVYPAWDTAKYAYGYKGLIDAEPIGAEVTEAIKEKTRLEDQYVNNIEELNQATNENNMVLFEVGQYNTGKTTPVSSIVRNDYDAKAVGSINWLGGNVNADDVRMSGKPYVDNHTLYITTQTNTGYHRGFRVADDVKTVFIQTNNREETTIFESGYSRLEKVIDRLHDHAEYGNWAGIYAYHYEISAVMENGKATVVVIRDLNNAGASFVDVRNRELRLYGNLFTALDGTVTGASNAVVVADGKEISPVRTGADSWGNYSVYSIPQGVTVGITDYDIDDIEAADGFRYMTNMPYNSLRVRELSRSMSFEMPAYDAWIIGSRRAFNNESIRGLVSSSVAAMNVGVTFNGNKPGDFFRVNYNDAIAVVITGLKADTDYSVTLGATPNGAAITRTADKDGTLTINYTLNGADIFNEYVRVESITLANGAPITPDNPKPPVEAKDAAVTVTKGLVNIKKDGKVISKITADFKMDTANMGVKTGDVLDIEPAEALNVQGAKDNGDGTFTVEETTVTISPKAGYIWHPLFRQYVDGEGKPTLVEWVSALAVNSVAKRFSLARAAGDDLVDTDKGEIKIDTNDLNWFMKAYLAGVRNFEFRTRLADGTVFVENVAIEGTKITVTYDKDKFTAEQYAEYLGVLDANVDDVVTVNPGTDPGPDDPKPPVTGSSTLTLTGNLIATRDTILDDQPVAVFAGPVGGTMERVTDWKLGNQASGNAGEVVTANYVIPNGYQVMIRPVTITNGVATETDATITADSIWLVGEVPVFLSEKTNFDDITFAMSGDMTLEMKAQDVIANGIRVEEVTIGTGIKGSWTKTGTNAISNVPLVEGKNYVYDGAVITFTDNGAGTKIIKGKAGFVAGDDANVATKVFDAKEKDTHVNTVTVNAAADNNYVTYSSAVKVSVVGTNAQAHVGGAKAADTTNAGYIAIGRELVMKEVTTEVFDGYILNAKAGAPLVNDTWKVEPVGEDKDVTIYGGIEVLLGEGVSAQWAAKANPTAADKKIDLKNGYCVVVSGTTDSYIVNAKTSTGTDVGMIAEAIWGDSTTTDTVVTAALEVKTDTDATLGSHLFDNGTPAAKYALESVTKVTLLGSATVDTTAVRWGYNEGCVETAFYEAAGLKTDGYYKANATAATFYVVTADNIYLKVDGAKLRDTNDVAQINPSNPVLKLGVYVGGVLDESIKGSNSYWTFKATGDEPISVRPIITSGDTDDKIDAIETALAAASKAAKGVIAIRDGVVHATGNYQYLGGDPDFNKAHLAWTAAGDLGEFIKQAHTTLSANTLYYKGTAYTWDASALGAGRGQYVRMDEDGNKVTIIADIVADCGYDVDVLNGQTVEVTIDDYTFKFMMHLDNNLETNMTTGKQENPT